MTQNPCETCDDCKGFINGDPICASACWDKKHCPDRREYQGYRKGAWAVVDRIRERAPSDNDTQADEMGNWLLSQGVDRP